MTKINIHDKKTILLMSKLEDEILELIDEKDEYTRSDLQGGAMAIVMKILRIGNEMGS